MDVEAVRLHYQQCRELPQVTMAHLHQMQALIRMRQGNIPQRLELLLTWLGQKFGCPTEGGQLIQLRLTHQELAETIGTTRVTVTRLMQNLEQQGNLYCSRGQQIVLRHPWGVRSHGLIRLVGRSGRPFTVSGSMSFNLAVIMNGKPIASHRLTVTVNWNE